MEFLKAENIKRLQNWTCIIYSEPGKGKTSMVKSITGRTLVFSTDGMYHVLSKLQDVDIVVMNPQTPNDDLGNFYRYLVKNLDKYENVVIDNLSTFQKFWLNAQAAMTKSGMPEMKDYGIIDRVLLDFIASLKKLNKNILIFAHEKKVEITRESGGVYTQFQPDMRNMDAVMGIVPIVGRLVIYKNQETQQDERIIVLQPTQSTRAKDQLLGDMPTIKQMDLLPTLQK